jgi:hypothetical protein
MTVGSNPDTARGDTPAVVAASIESDKRMNQPQAPGRVQVHGEQTIGISSGGRDPVTGRRYPSSVYAGTGVGVGDPRVGDPPPADSREECFMPSAGYNRAAGSVLRGATWTIDHANERGIPATA